MLVNLPATLPPPKDRAGVVYDHSRRRVAAKRPAQQELLAQRRARSRRKRAGR
jgi:hypothetical protein